MKAAAVIALAFCPAIVQAHLINTGLGPVNDGITHFALTPEDFLPVIALAVLAGLRGTAYARITMLTLPLAWLLAGVAGDMARIAMPESLAWLPLVAIGLLVAADVRVSPVAMVSLAVMLGGALGYGNGAALAQAGAGLRGIAGVSATVFVLTTLAAAGAVAWQTGWMRIAWRVAGSWIAAGGLLLLGWALR